MVAVSAESFSEAEAFVQESGWKADVQVIDGEGALGNRGLTRRTPWFFLIDDGGKIISEGHGAKIERALDPRAMPSDE